MENTSEWLDMEGADDGEVLVVNVMKVDREECPKCLTIVDKFLVRRERKEFERKKKIEAGEYMAGCFTKQKNIYCGGAIMIRTRSGNSWMRRR
jgi:hypothetical protein